MQRPTRRIGFEAAYRKLRTSQREAGQRVYPCPLWNLAIEQPEQVWCADITYLPPQRGFLHVVGVMG